MYSNQRSRGHALNLIRPYPAVLRCIRAPSYPHGALNALHDPVLPPSCWRPRHAGSLISTAYLIRHSVNVLANGVVAFCYNGPPSGGSFSWGLTTQQLMWITVSHCQFTMN